MKLSLYFYVKRLNHPIKIKIKQNIYYLQKMGRNLMMAIRKILFSPPDITEEEIDGVSYYLLLKHGHDPIPARYTFNSLMVHF